MPIINRFDGGLVTGVNPIYLDNSQSTVLLNANIESVGIESAKLPLKYTEGLRSFYQYKILDSEPEEFHVTSSRNKRSYVEFQGSLAYSDGGPVCQITDGTWNETVGDGEADFVWNDLGVVAASGNLLTRVVTMLEDIPGSATNVVTHADETGGTINQPTIRYRLVDSNDTVYSHFIDNLSGFSTIEFTLPTTDFSIYREELDIYGYPSNRFILVSTGETFFVDGLPDITTAEIEEEDSIINMNIIPPYAGHRMSVHNGKGWTSPYTLSVTPTTTVLTVYNLRGVDIYETWETKAFNRSITIPRFDGTTSVGNIASTFVLENELYVHMKLGQESRIYKEDGTLIYSSSVGLSTEYFKGTTIEHEGLLYMFNPLHGKVGIFNGSVMTFKDTEIFPYAYAANSIYVLKGDTVYCILNERHEANVRKIQLPSLEFGFSDKERIPTATIRGLGGTSNSNLLDGDDVVFPVHGKTVRFSPSTNQITSPDVQICLQPTIPNDLEFQTSLVVTAPEGSCGIKGFAVYTRRAHSVVSSECINSINDSLTSWILYPEDPPEYFNFRTLTGTFVYNVAQKTPDGTSEGPIMDTESTPVTVVMGHVTIDSSDIEHTYPLRLYRTGGYLTRFTMVDDIDLPEVYIDTRDDVTIALGRNGNYDFVDAPPEGLNYLTSHRGRLFGAVGSKIYWSEAGNANSWDELQSFVVMDRDVTALATCGNGLLIFMKGRINLLLGDYRNNFSLRTVSMEKGTLDSYSVKSAINGAFFFSEDGLCFTDGSQIHELSYNILGPQRFDVLDSTATNRSYYALLKGYVDGSLFRSLHILRYDFGKEPVFSLLEGEGVEGLGTIDGRLAHSADNIIYDTLAEGLREFNYQSGNITEGIPTMVKEWDRVRVAGEFIGKLNIYIENKLTLSKDIVLYEDTEVNLHIPKGKNKGKYISFELKGIGQISAIEYSITPRKTTK